MKCRKTTLAAPAAGACLAADAHRMDQNGKGKKALARSRKAKLSLAIAAVDEQGRSSQATGSVSLKR